jgi:uncharacterized membrane protein YeaQ/YmgE (transglycosylase-associated protein family)
VIPLGAAFANQQSSEAHIVSFIAWVVLGLIAGFSASQIVNRRGEGFFLDIVLGTVGALVGGFIFNAFGAAGVTDFNAWSLLVAVCGAIAVLFIYHALFRRRLL